MKTSKIFLSAFVLIINLFISLFPYSSVAGDNNGAAVQEEARNKAKDLAPTKRTNDVSSEVMRQNTDAKV